MRHSSLGSSSASDVKKTPDTTAASPRAPIPTTAAALSVDTARTTLPTLAGGGGCVQSPNVAKRNVLTAARLPAAETLSSGDIPAVADPHEIIDRQQQQQQPQPQPLDDGDASSMEAAVEILEAIAREHAPQSEVLRRRAALLQQTDALRSNEAKEHEAQQLAYLEHMHATVQLLQQDLETERRRNGASHHTSGSINGGDSLDAAATKALDSCSASSFTGLNVGASGKSSVKRAAELPMKLRESPLRGRFRSGPTSAQVNAHADLQNALEKNANARMRARAAEKSAFEREAREQRGEVFGDVQEVCAREQKLREALGERAYWQREYEAMRDQVVQEKTRQAELFRVLEKAKRDCSRRTDELERALRESSVEVELLRSQLAETRVCTAQQKRAAEALVKSAREEKDRLVCSIAETRHKFKEWKEGETSTLKAARDQAVHNLKTEYESKIARHHEEKQKLRDKVKDLEVSLRLLQKDRHLSPAELSLRKATILGSKEGGSTTEAELIEANCRIKELEVLLNHAKEHQKRQEHIIRVSESAMTRLMEEREVVALENLTLQPLTSLRAGSLTLAKVVDPIDSVSMGLSGARHSDALPQTHPVSPGTATPSAVGEFAIDGAIASATTAGLQTMRPPVAASMVHNGSRTRSVADSPSFKRRLSSSVSKYASGNESALVQSNLAADPEKEILRRQSIVLSAEVEKYRQIVVHSLDEIRTLKDSRRRSLHGMAPGSPNGNTATLKEQYLMSEVIRLQSELEAMKTSQKKRERKTKWRVKKDTADASNDGESSSSDDGSGSNSGNDSGAESTSSESEKKEPPQFAREAAARVSIMREEGEEYSEGEDTQEKCQQDSVCAQDQPDKLRVASATKLSPSFRASSLAPLETSLEDTTVQIKEKDVAVTVIQNKSKTFLLRRDFIKQKIAIDKIKARYRGYLVRKNVELLDRHQKKFVVSQAVQYKMEIVNAHHEMAYKCHGLLLKLVIRVSKDPPIVQIQMTPAKQPEPSPTDPLSRFDAPMHDELRGTRVTYIHLFEIVALLPHEEESEILEKATEKEIAETFASLLSVVRVGGQYRFAIKRKVEGSTDSHEHIVHFSHFPSSSSMLSELPVEKMPEKDAPSQKPSEKDSVDDARELEDLIRKARVPLPDNVASVDFNDLNANISSRADHVHLKKFLRRLPSSSPGITPANPHTGGGAGAFQLT